MVTRRLTAMRHPGQPTAPTASLPRGVLRHAGPATGAKLPRDAACRLGYGRAQTLCRAARHDRLGLPHDADRPDGGAGSIEDRSRDARLAEHGLVTFAGDPALANRPLARCEARLAERVRPVSLGRPRPRPVVHVLPAASRRGSPCPSELACTGSSAPTSRTWKVASGRKTWWTTTTVGPCITPTRTEADERSAKRSA